MYLYLETWFTSTHNIIKYLIIIDILLCLRKQERETKLDREERKKKEEEEEQYIFVALESYSSSVPI